jgi:hypothetical protein
MFCRVRYNRFRMAGRIAMEAMALAKAGPPAEDHLRRHEPAKSARASSPDEAASVAKPTSFKNLF